MSGGNMTANIDIMRNTRKLSVNLNTEKAQNSVVMAPTVTTGVKKIALDRKTKNSPQKIIIKT